MTPPPDLDRLLSGLCDGTLSAADADRLGSAVAADPAVRAEYLQYLDLHAVLGGPVGADMLEPALRPSRSRFRWAAGVAVAAGVVVAIWLGLRPTAHPPEIINAPEPSITVAEVWGRAEVRDETGAAATAASVGTALRSGQTVRTESGDGFAALDLGGGSRVELGPDAQLRVADGGPGGGLRLVLSAGLLRADVRGGGWPQGLAVVTTQAEVTARDARFLVSAVTADATDVEAEAGTVRAVRHADGRSVDVPAGSGAMIAAGDPMGVHATAVSGLVPASLSKVQAHFGLAFAPGGRLVVRLKAGRWATVEPGPGTVVPGPILPAGTGVGLTADGESFFLARSTGRVDRYETATGALRSGFDAADATAAPLSVWGFSTDGQTAAAGYASPKGPIAVQLWLAGQPTPPIPLVRPARCVAVSADGRLAAWAFDQAGQRPVHQLIVWDVAAGRVAHTISIGPRPLRMLAFSPDGRQLAGATDHGAVDVWEVAGGRWVAGRGPDDGWARPVTALAFAPTGRRLAAGRTDGRVFLWDIEDGGDSTVLAAGTRPVTALAFSPDGTALAAGPLREPVSVWHLPPQGRSPVPPPK